MFGRRPDGRRLKQPDPILALTPYLMPQRVDAQVHSVIRVNCDTLTQYIRQQREKGFDLSYMDLIAAAYVRTISQNPALNRFVMNKQVYARNAIHISLAMIREQGEEIMETTIKPRFSPYDTVYDVHNKFREEIDKNREPEAANNTDRLAGFVMSLPGLATALVWLVRLLDRYGLLPRIVIRLSPFHTGLFIANMASIGMPHVNHHIYNFGTTSLFIGMGSVERNVAVKRDGTAGHERMIPLGLVSDERITSGADYGRAMTAFRSFMNNPASLETPPETVKYDIPPEKMPHPDGRRQRRKENRQRSASET
ncbi:MAG: 2-oxo acid dehydrogenase subunit E2 [Clostridia bacterium]|nr:2-oxo acid dehydrogenase subunit E2 [Clostridia bacterium]